MRYAYNVIYYTYSSLYCQQEYENEIFSSYKRAKGFMNKIVREEDRSSNDKDFYSFKIKIIKKEINTIEEDKEARIYIYDLRGKLLYDSLGEYPIDNRFTRKFHIGDTVKIIPYPWSIESCCEIEVFGIVAGYHNKKYTVYTIDNYKVVHLHAKEISLKYIDNRDKKIKSLLKDMQNIILEDANSSISEENIHIIHTIKKQ